MVLVISFFTLTLPLMSETAGGLSFSRPNIRIDQSPMNTWYPSIAADDLGVLHAVWENNVTADPSISYSSSTDSGLTWSPEVEIDFQSPGHKHRKPKIAIDTTSPLHKGSIYVVYEAIIGGDWHIQISYSHDRGGTWLFTRVDHGDVTIRSQQPSVGVTGDGTVYVAWKDGRNPVYQIYVSSSHDGGLTWTSDTRVSVTDEWNVSPSVATSGLTDVYVVWQEYYDVYFTAIWCAHSSDGVNWYATHVIDSQTFRIVRENPDVGVEPSGGVIVAWAFREQDNDWRVEFSRSDDSGASWTDPVRVDHGGPHVTAQDAPRISVGAGNIYIVWSCERQSDFGVYFTYSSDGGRSWNGGGELSLDAIVDDTLGNGDPNDDDTRQQYPAIAAYGHEVYVVWQDKRSIANWHVYFAKTLISSLQITEIRDSPDGQEVIEIYNYGSADFDLTNVQIRVDGVGEIDLSPLGILPAGTHRTVGDGPSADLTIDITLGDEGGFLILHRAVSYFDFVGYGQRGITPDPIAGESVARYWAGMRYDFDWVRDPTPTFGSNNDAPNVERDPRLVLNEVLFNPLIASDAFIEVMLIEGKQIDTNGYVIACDSVHVLPSINLTEENPTYAVMRSASPTLFSSLTSSGDNVYLYDSSGRLVDMVGWSTPHTPGLSMARVPEGNGTYDGYDDGTSSQAGWDFDVIPTPSVVSIGPDQWKNGNPDEQVSYELVVSNRGGGADYIDITYHSEPNGWSVELFHADGMTPLTDSLADGDGVPDVGLVPLFSTITMVVKVTVPTSPGVQTYENTTVRATSSNNPSLWGEALLVTRPYPSVEVNKSLFPGEIYVESSGPGHVMETTITLEVRGTGSSIYYDTPQDVIFLVDKSNSIGDLNFSLEKTLVLTYLKQMRRPDRAAVVFFAGLPIFKGTLSGNMAEVEADLRTESRVIPDPEPGLPSSHTRIGCAINETVHYLYDHGKEDHKKMVFLFTDGINAWQAPIDPHPWQPVEWASVRNISVYPIGIRGNHGGPETWLLEGMARISGTRYLFADSAQIMDGMRDEIGLIERSVALYDPDMTDTGALIQDTLPPYIHYVANSAIDPETGAGRPPTIRTHPVGTALAWDELSIHVGDFWSVSFRVTCGLEGYQLANVPPDSRAMGLDWSGTQRVILFPTVYVDCLAPPPIAKPDGLSAELEGTSFRDIRITWNLSPDDPERVDHYEVYFSKIFDPSGSGYSLLGTSPAGIGEYLVEYLGGDSLNYFFRVCAATSTGERGCADQQAAKFTRALYAGPNLVSIPLIQSNGSIDKVLQTVEFDKAWSYDSSRNKWIWFMRSKPYKGELATVNRTIGLWVNVTMDCRLTIAGAVPESTTIHLSEGWNLVGFPSFDHSFTVSELYTTTGATRVETCDYSMPPYYLQMLNETEVLEAGLGYWVSVETDIDWIVDVK